jgi:putative endonuclease
MFACVDFAARKGLAEAPAANAAADASKLARKRQARTTGVRGETYAYWYLRRHGYTIVAQNFTSPNLKGELDLVGYDRDVLAFVEVKTRAAAAGRDAARPEDAVNFEKRRNLIRIARHFLRAWRIEPTVSYRFDVLAIEARHGERPVLRLHKGAFTPSTPSAH